MSLLCCVEDNEVRDFDRDRKSNNHCTDLPFAIFFSIFLIGFLFIASYAFAIGSPLRLIHGTDSFGNVCGQKNSKIDNLPFTGLDLRNRPNLFHLNQRDPKNSLKICVKKCPNKDLNNMAEVYTFFTKYNSSLCRYDFDFSNFSPPTTSPNPYPSLPVPSSSALLNDSGLCPTFPIFRNRRLLYYCVPEQAILQGVALGHTLYDFLSSHVPLKKIVSDLINSHEEMMIMCAVAIGSSIISVFVIHFIASLASWLILVLISVLLVTLTIIFWWIYFLAHNRQDLPNLPKNVQRFLPEDAENESILLTISIICTILTLVILYAAASMRSHVKFVVALFHETASCLRSMPFLLFQPLWTLLALITFLSLWILTLMALATSEHFTKNQRLLQTNTEKDIMLLQQRSSMTSFTLIKYNQSSWIQFTWWYMIIALVWMAEFFCSCQQLIIAGAVSSWYFSRDRNNLGFPILNSIKDLVCRHIGSVALGSFLITLVKLPRLIIQQTTLRLRKFDKYRLVRCALDACACCLWMVEKFLNYLTRNAYTMVVLKRQNFCTSARLAFQTIFSNAIRVAAINSIGDFILLLGKLIVASITAIVGVFLIRNNPAVHYWTVPVVLMSVFGFWVAHCLLSVYEMVIDAMFLCFCHDMNIHDGSPGNEYYAPESLMKFLREEEEGQAMSEIRPDGQIPTVPPPEDDNDVVKYPDLTNDDYSTIR